jgi:hypothetical protein
MRIAEVSIAGYRSLRATRFPAGQLSSPGQARLLNACDRPVMKVA